MDILTFGWEETPNEIRHRLMDPADFQQDTFKRKTLPNGIGLILGKLNSDKVPKGGNADAMVTQSLRFPLKSDKQPDGFDMETAKKWAEENFTACVNHDRMNGSVENMADHETVAKDTMPASDAGSDEKRKAREARSQKYGIEIVDGGSLTPGADRPTDPDQYADPVNFAYPIDTLAHANNARARFKQAFSTYKDAASQKTIHNRIVAAQIAMGGQPSYDETDARDKMLDPKLVDKIKSFVSRVDLTGHAGGSLMDYLAGRLKDEQLQAFREMADLGNAKTFQRTGVQIFSTGTWNGDKYTERDLDELVKNFNELKSQIKPPLKLGHKDQLGRMDPDWNNTGQPAFGWVTNVYREGDKLLADFNYIPQRINDLIEHRAYARLSVEISPNYAMTDPKTDKVKTYGKVLRGVALLGGDVPAVTTLADVASLYRADDSLMGSAQTVAYEMRMTIQPTTTGGQPVSEKTQTESVANQATVDFAAREKALADREAAVKATEDSAKALAEDNAKLRAQARDNDIAAFTASLVRDGKLLPANVESAKNGLVSAYDHEELLGADGLKKFSESHANRGPVAIAKDMLSNVPTKVTFGEVATQPAAKTEGSAPGSEGLPMTQFTEDAKGDLWFSDHKGQRFPVMNVALDKKAKSIMAANATLTYGDALVLAERALRSSAAK